MSESPQTNAGPSPSMFSLSKRAAKLAALRADTSLYYFPGQDRCDVNDALNPWKSTTMLRSWLRVAGVMKALTAALWCVNFHPCVMLSDAECSAR